MFTPNNYQRQALRKLQYGLTILQLSHKKIFLLLLLLTGLFPYFDGPAPISPANNFQCQPKDLEVEVNNEEAWNTSATVSNLEPVTY